MTVIFPLTAQLVMCGHELRVTWPCVTCHMAMCHVEQPPPWPQAGAILVLGLATTTTTQLHKRPTVFQITRVIHSVEINNQCIPQILIFCGN